MNLNFLERIFVKLKRTGINQFNSKDFTELNNLEYVTDLYENRDNSIKSFSKFCITDNKCLLFYPYNDGRATSCFSWYIKKNKIIQEFVINNQKAFYEITNLSDILIQMMDLYINSLDKDYVICSYNFALKLEDKVVNNYIGRASLIVTEYTIWIDKYQEGETLKSAKRHCVNEFLDYFMGYNFGKLIKENDELRDKLIYLNNLVIEKNLRRYLKGRVVAPSISEYREVYNLPHK